MSNTTPMQGCSLERLAARERKSRQSGSGAGMSASRGWMSIEHPHHSLYAPPNHRDGIVHPTRADAEADNEHFDGKTTE